jgi:putative ABC transport system ATP-binding protein
MSGILVSDLHFTYPGSPFRLRVDDLAVESGGSFALLGPSGAGKTTLLRLMSGLLAPEKGEVRLGDTTLTGMSEAKRRAFRLSEVGLVFQDFALLDYLTVSENILLPHQFRGEVVTAARTKMLELTQRLHIDRYLDKRVSQLSQGERQRVAVARALVHEPQFVFADEPTASLDPARGRIVVDMLLEDTRKRGACLVMVTHDPNLLPLFDQTVRMEDLATA